MTETLELSGPWAAVMDDRVRPCHETPLASKPPTEGSWLQVLGGRAFSLTNPRAEDVDFDKIAIVLSRVPRFGGHTEDGVLSVAQHCLEGSAAILRDTGRRDATLAKQAAAAFLIHDAHEAYMGDLPTPVQDALCAMAAEWGSAQRYPSKGVAERAVKAAIRRLKLKLDDAIFPAAGLPYPLAPDVLAIVKDYDRRMCGTEHAGRMLPLPAPYPYISEAVPVEGCDLYPWSAGTVEKCFKAACRQLLPALGGDAGFGPGAKARLVLSVDSHETA